MHDTTRIPVFPLPIVAFPEEELRLHIFEPRYKQLLADCEASGIVFCILPVLEDVTQERGSLVRLEDIVKRYEDGRLDIKLKCLELCDVTQFHQNTPNKLYASVDIIERNSKSVRFPELQEEIIKLFTELCQINRAKPYHPISWDVFNSFLIGHFVGFTLEEEYAFIMVNSEKERLTKLIAQIHKMIEHSLLRKNWLTRLNMNGEFRDFKISNDK
ncbi:MAG: LON peptidase substrate-binding domain-containing protein [Bacteroidota bacterium]|nr:LON peptidase substrate-binding domain-containing protein [Bacteroidota bacterium]